MISVLTIAGSDSSGGAGLQGDLKTIAAHGLHGLSAITAVTAQNTQGILDISPVANLGLQLEALSKDLKIHAIKIGMLYSLDMVNVVIDFIQSYARPNRIPVILDPVMYASTGKALITSQAMARLVDGLMPLCTLVTPNVHEAAYLIGRDFQEEEAPELLPLLAETIGTCLLLKGGHHSSDASTDLLYVKGRMYSYAAPRLTGLHTHGTGCCLSSSIACQMAIGRSIEDAVRLGKSFVTMAIDHGYPLGKGEGPVDPLIHFITNSVTVNDVANCCLALGSRPIMAEAPEEMADIVPMEKGLVLNLGTLTKQRLHLMLTALSHIKAQDQLVLLDPVGCGASKFRLQGAKDLLATGKINCLKVNPVEGLALCDQGKPGAYGVDSDALDVVSKKRLAANLLGLYGPLNPGLVLVITGIADIVATSDHLQVIRGGTAMQGRITGTGCMLNAVLMDSMIKDNKLYHGAVRGVKSMNLASERATKRLTNKQHTMTYRELLINELNTTNKDIYLITDEALDFETVLLPKTTEALVAGVRILQYRAKNKSPQEMYHEATTLRQLTNTYGASLIINDHIDLAKAVKADGVHLGIDDASISRARKVLGDKCLIGATAKTVLQAQEAQKLGADYLGVGAIHPSPSKKDAIQIQASDLLAIQSKVDIPIYGIGGIRHHNLSAELVQAMDGVAVISAVYEGGIKELNQLTQHLRR